MIKKKTVKELLGESLEELLKNKPFDKIRVSEIADNCGVGRRTFYNYFTDKNDLVSWLYIRQLSEFIETTSNAELKDFIKYSAEVVVKDHQTLKALDKYRGQNNIRDSLTNPMVDLYVKAIEKYYGCTVCGTGTSIPYSQQGYHRSPSRGEAGAFGRRIRQRFGRYHFPAYTGAWRISPGIVGDDNMEML